MNGNPPPVNKSQSVSMHIESRSPSESSTPSESSKDIGGLKGHNVTSSSESINLLDINNFEKFLKLFDQAIFDQTTNGNALLKEGDMKKHDVTNLKSSETLPDIPGKTNQLASILGTPPPAESSDTSRAVETPQTASKASEVSFDQQYKGLDWRKETSSDLSDFTFDEPVDEIEDAENELTKTENKVSKAKDELQKELNKYSSDSTEMSLESAKKYFNPKIRANATQLEKVNKKLNKVNKKLNKAKIFTILTRGKLKKQKKLLENEKRLLVKGKKDLRNKTTKINELKIKVDFAISEVSSKEKAQLAANQCVKENKEAIKNSSVFKNFLVEQGHPDDVLEWIDVEHLEKALGDFSNHLVDLITKDIISENDVGGGLQRLDNLSQGEVLIGKNPSLGTEKPTKEAHTHAWEHFDEVSSGIVSQFPNIKINTDPKAKVGDPPTVDNFNNYGLQPDQGTEVKKDEKGNVKSFMYNGKKIIPPKEHAVEKDGLIFYKRNSQSLIYHDNALSTDNNTGPHVITLCDGTGQSHASKKAAMVASKTAQTFTQNGIGKCKTLQDALKLQFSAMKEAQTKLLDDEEAQQGTTFVQASVTGNILSGVTVGDSKVFVFSQKEGGGWTCRDAVGESRAKLDPRDSGGRLSGPLGDKKDDMELAGMRAFAVKLQPGDIVYTCSDGGHDNFDPSNLGDEKNTPKALGGTGTKWKEDDPKHMELAQKGMVMNFERTVKDCNTPEEMHAAIKKESQARTEADKLYYITTPKDKMGQPPHISGQGKADDAAMVFFQYFPE